MEKKGEGKRTPRPAGAKWQRKHKYKEEWKDYGQRAVRRIERAYWSGAPKVLQCKRVVL